MKAGKFLFGLLAVTAIGIFGGNASAADLTETLLNQCCDTDPAGTKQLNPAGYELLKDYGVEGHEEHLPALAVLDDARIQLIMASGRSQFEIIPCLPDIERVGKELFQRDILICFQNRNYVVENLFVFNKKIW